MTGTSRRRQRRRRRLRSDRLRQKWLSDGKELERRIESWTQTQEPNAMLVGLRLPRPSPRVRIAEQYVHQCIAAVMETADSVSKLIQSFKSEKGPGNVG